MKLTKNMKMILCVVIAVLLVALVVLVIVATNMESQIPNSPTVVQTDAQGNTVLTTTGDGTPGQTGDTGNPGVTQQPTQEGETVATQGEGETTQPTQPGQPTQPTEPTVKPTLPDGIVGVEIWDETQPPTNPTTKPTVKPTTPTVKPTDPTVKPTDPTVKPTEPTVKPTEPTPTQPDEMTWKEYLSLSDQQRYEHYLTFDSMDAFFAWKNKAEAEYNATTEPKPTTNGSIDIGDLINGNN